MKKPKKEKELIAPLEVRYVYISPEEYEGNVERGLGILASIIARNILEKRSRKIMKDKVNSMNSEIETNYSI